VLKIDQKENYLEIIIDREKSLNSLSPEVFDLLIEQFKKSETESNIILIKTSGDRAFIAGADIKAMSNMSADDLKDFSNKAHEVIELISKSAQIVISYVDGIAYGGGLELALGSDLIVANENARFAMPELKLGLIPGFGGTQRIIERCGLGLARKMIFLSQELSSNEALDYNLIDYVVSNEQDLDEIIDNLASKSRESLASAKSSINTFFSNNLNIGINKEKDEFLKTFLTANAKEGISAFIEKRKAQYK